VGIGVVNLLEQIGAVSYPALCLASGRDDHLQRGHPVQQEGDLALQEGDGRLAPRREGGPHLPGL